MDHNHPTPEELEGVVLGGISAEQARGVILHLLGGCEECNRALLPYVPPRWFPSGSHLAAPPTFQPDDYDAPIDRAFAAVGPLFPARNTAEEHKREALGFLAAGGLNSIADAPRHLAGLPLFEALLERGWALRHDDPPQMVELARVATFQADHMSESKLGAQAVADLRCRAWTELANAYRVADELDAAETTLGQATEHFFQGTQDERLLARFFDVFASQQAARRLFDLACSTLDLAVTIYQQHEDAHLAGRALIMKGIFSGYAGEAEKAILSLEQGLSLVDEERDPGLVFSALQSQSWFLVDCGRYQKAHRALWELRCRRLDLGGRLGELKLRWLEGHINAGLKKFDLAERDLGTVKEGFEEAGLGYKAALVGLELGEVWLRQGHNRKAEAIVLECADVFISLGIRRELIATILVLRKSAKTRLLNLTVLRYAIDLLHKEERDPTSPREEP